MSGKYKDYCPKCSGELVAKKGKFGDFFGCSNYPNCKYVTKYRARQTRSNSDFRDSQVYSGSFENGKKR